MDIKRYIIVQAIKTEKNVLIPIWDERLQFEDTEMYGTQISIKGERDKYYSVVECIYDLKTKKIELGIEFDYYPKEEDIEFKEGQSIMYEKSHRKLDEATIQKIIYEEYDLNIMKGKKLDKYWIERCNINVDLNAIYAIKHWKPFYLLNNGMKIEYNHQLYHKD